jgi:hypothetical protein
MALSIPDISDARSSLKPLTVRLHPQQRVKLQYLSAILEFDESKLTREAIELLFEKHSKMLDKRFSADAIYDEFERRLDSLRLSDLVPELLTLDRDFNLFFTTREKVLERFKARVAELALQDEPRSERVPSFKISWGETTKEAAARLVKCATNL